MDRNSNSDLEVDFSDRIPAQLRLRALAAADASDRFLSNELRSLLRLLIEDDLVRAMDLVIRQNAVLEHEPPRPPPLAVIHPLVEDAGDPIPDNIVQFHGLPPISVQEDRRIKGGSERPGSDERGCWTRAREVAAVAEIGGGRGGVVAAGWAAA